MRIQVVWRQPVTKSSITAAWREYYTTENVEGIYGSLHWLPFVWEHVNRSVLHHTPNYTGNGSDSSSSVNTYYYCYLCCVYTSPYGWVWVHGVRQSLFNAACRLCKWKHHTLPKCSRLNAAVWRTLFAWLSPGCREKENTLSQVSVLLLSVIQLYLCLKMATLAKHTQWGICAVAQPPADLNACLCYSSGWSSLLKGLSQWANTPTICLSQPGMFLPVVVYNSHL